MVEERNFAELAGEFACDNFRKRHEASLWVGRHGEAALERARAVRSADTSAEHEGVAAVEGDSWLEVDWSRRVRHVISGEIPYLVRHTLRHAEQRANALSLVTSPTTFVYLLMVSLQ
jgi:hypothetical protein